MESASSLLAQCFGQMVGLVPGGFKVVLKPGWEHFGSWEVYMAIKYRLVMRRTYSCSVPSGGGNYTNI